MYITRSKMLVQLELDSERIFGERIQKIENTEIQNSNS